MSQLDLRLLRYFVAVAETEHVGRAAGRLGLSQSPLSRQLRRLERQLALSLFVRDGRRLQLSDAGRRFLPEALKLLRDARRVERWAERLARGESARVSLGYVRNALWNGLLPAALSRFRAQHPEVEIELHNCATPVQLQMLLRREIDVGVAHWRSAHPKVLSECVARHALCLAMPRGQLIGTSAAVEPADLDTVPWISIERKQHPAAYDQVLAACSKAGLQPKVQYETSDLPMALSLVAAGLGVALVPEGVPNPNPALVEIRPLPWLDLELQLYMLRRREPPTTQIRDLARLLRSGITRQLRTRPAPAPTAGRAR
jgi:DNA-binding transcriptional LysR family regulator